MTNQTLLTTCITALPRVLTSLWEKHHFNILNTSIPILSQNIERICRMIAVWILTFTIDFDINVSIENTLAWEVITLFWLLSVYVEWNDGREREKERETDRQRQKDRPMGELLLEATWPHITSETCRCRRHCCLTKWTETRAQTLHTPCYCKLLHGLVSRIL